jgi:hypothetical protein
MWTFWSKLTLVNLLIWAAAHSDSAIAICGPNSSQENICDITAEEKETYHDGYSETCEPKETKVDKIKSLAIKLNPRKSFPEGLANFLKDIKIIILGEIHGTKQVPELFAKMVQSVADENSRTLVILEINQSSQSSIDRFVKSGDESVLQQDEFFYRKYQDGRSSKAMVKLRYF